MDCRLSFLGGGFHLSSEFVDRFQARGVLSRLKAYTRDSSRVQQKQRLLCHRVDVVVMLELCDGQEVILVILSFVDE